MRVFRWLVDCLITLFAAFRNALTDDRVTPPPQSTEDIQQRASQTALRELDRLKNLPPDT